MYSAIIKAEEMPDLGTDLMAEPQDHNYAFCEKVAELLTLVFLFTDVVCKRCFPSFFALVTFIAPTPKCSQIYSAIIVCVVSVNKLLR